MKRWIALLFLFLSLFASCAHAESYTSATWRDGNVYFSVSYNAQNDTYWIMVFEYRTIFGIRIPIVPRYQVYCIDGNLTTATPVFSTDHRIYRLLAHGDRLYYEREVLFDPMSNNIFCYNTKTHENTKCMPGQAQLIRSVSSKELIYNDWDNGDLYTYNIEQQCKRLISEDSSIFAYDSQGLYFHDSENKIKKYCFENGAICDINFPDDVDYVWDGYGINQSKGLLYSPTGDIHDISYLKDAYTFNVTEGILYAYYSDTKKCMYAFLDDPSVPHEVKLEKKPEWGERTNVTDGEILHYTYSLNVANGKIFGTAMVHKKCVLFVFDARTEETKIISLR